MPITNHDYKERNIGTAIIKYKLSGRTDTIISELHQSLAYIATLWHPIKSGTKGVPLALWIVILLAPTVPTGFIVKYTNQTPEKTFAVNFIAVIPLSSILTLVSDELNARKGGRSAIFLLITTGNIVQLVLAIQNLIQDRILVLQSSFVGTVIVNATLMVGLGFLLGGINRNHQNFNQTGTLILLNQLTLSVASLILPVAFKAWANETTSTKSANITAISRAASILIFLGYLCYVFYSFRTHSALFLSPHEKVEKKMRRRELGTVASLLPRTLSSYSLPTIQSSASKHTRKNYMSRVPGRVLAAIIVVDLILLGLCTKFMTDSIDNLDYKTGTLSQEFIGLILYPLLSCNLHAITLARRDEMPQSFEISIHSSIQLLLCILPLIILIGWIVGKEQMNLAFDGFQVTCLFIILQCLRSSVQNGSSHWFSGVVLIALWSVVALSAWLYPPKNPPPVVDT